MDRQDMLDRIYEISKEARIANKKSVERNDKCMSVPPLMMYRIAKEIKTQWLEKLDTFI